jgi:hypothetical protein
VTWDYQAVGSGNGEVYGARVTEDGSVLDPSGIPIATGPHYQRASAVAFDGANFMVAWTDGTDPGDIYCARVSPNGTVLDPSGIPVSTAPGDQQAPAITFDGTNFLIVWQDERNGDADVYGARVTPGGSSARSRRDPDLHEAGSAAATAAARPAARSAHRRRRPNRPRHSHLPAHRYHRHRDLRHRLPGAAFRA